MVRGSLRCADPINLPIRISLEIIGFSRLAYGRSLFLRPFRIGVRASTLLAYFMLERLKPRYEGRWEGFDEGPRVIGDRSFPTMSFKVTYSEKHHVADCLFVLYFPQGFEQRRKFFTFMWLDGHADDQPGSGLDTLDAILSSLSAKP